MLTVQAGDLYFDGLVIFSIPIFGWFPQLLMLRYTLSTGSFIAAEVRMPSLHLPPRITPDTKAMLATAQAAGWDVLRLGSWLQRSLDL